MHRARTARTREVPCTDPFGRPAVMRVTLDTTGKVFVTAPPGESGWFSPEQLTLLVGALNEAIGWSRDLRHYQRAS